jgi:hypothetical protein
MVSWKLESRTAIESKSSTDLLESDAIGEGNAYLVEPRIVQDVCAAFANNGGPLDAVAVYRTVAAIFANIAI